MLTGTDEIAEPTIEELVKFWTGLGGQPLDSQEFINGRGRLEDLELAVGIRPEIFLGVGK